MKNISRTLKIIFFIFLFIIIALLALVMTFDANNYKPQIIEQVENATERSFSIDGEIELSVFPWIGLKIEDTWLGNEQGFSAEKFAAIKQLDVKVNVLPLLKKEVEINTIRLHGLNVSLEVAKNKTNNWSSLSQPKDAAADKESVKEVAEDSKSDAAPGDNASPLQSLKVEGFEFVDAVIIYDDRSSGTKATVSELNLQTSAITFDEAIDVSFSAHIENNAPQVDTRLNIETQLIINKELSVFNLNNLVMTVFTKANEFIKQDEEVVLKSSIDVLMEKQLLTIKQLQLDALGTTTLANIVISDFLKAPLIKGDIEVRTFNARDVAQRAGMLLPEMAKSDALNRVGLKATIKQQGELAEINDLRVSLDESTLSGWLHVTNISKQRLRYDLAFDQLNINHYLPPVVEPIDSESEVAAGSGGAAQGVAATATTGDEKIELPIAMLRQLDVKGDFRIAELKAEEYDIKQFLMTMNAAKGVINIKPLSMQVLQGDLAAALGMNVTKEMPAYTINFDASQLQVGPVANPFLKGVMGDKPLTMEGAADFTMAIKTSGDSVNQLKKSSLGNIVLDMKQTEVNGFDPEFYMRSSIASYLDESGFGLSKTIMGSYTPREVTVFDTIHSSIKVANGVADTQDFLMDSKRVQVGAQGYANIVNNTLDVTSWVKLARSKTAIEKVLDSPIYVRAHGPFAALQFELDKGRLKESTTDVLKNEAKAKLDAEKQKLKAKADAEKQRLKAKADEEKRRAEEKAKQELKEKTDEYEDKLKDKLKGLF